MPFILLAILLLALIFGPQWWAQYTFRRYARTHERLPGTGGELARHLLDRFDMRDVAVERTEPGQDHYDPRTRTVRLSPDNHDGRSLTAIAVAAHEVGHAIQHHRNEPMLLWRNRLVAWAAGAQRFGAGAMLLIPVAALVTRSPAAGLLVFLIGFGSMFLTTLVHLVTLPVELDASFNKALPILAEGYLEKHELPAARRILRAAALTYLAGSLASLLNLGRWLALLRRG